MPGSVIKLSSPETNEFWEIPILFEDEHLLALNKPPRLLTVPSADKPDQPDLVSLLHKGIADQKAWAREHNLSYLVNAHRLDAEISGVLLFAKSKQVQTALADLFGSERPIITYTALVNGSPEEDAFDIDVPIGPHPRVEGLVAANPKSGKKSKTHVEVIKRFRGYTLVKVQPLTNRLHQVRVHLRWVQLPIAGDHDYHGKPLLLSEIKTHYRLGPGKEERPLISSPALHAQEVTFPHPVTNESLTIKAEWPKDLEVAVKYLKKFAGL